MMMKKLLLLLALFAPIFFAMAVAQSITTEVELTVVTVTTFSTTLHFTGTYTTLLSTISQPDTTIVSSIRTAPISSVTNPSTTIRPPEEGHAAAVFMAVPVVVALFA